MYEPECSVSGFGDDVIVRVDNAFGYAFGTYTGYSRGDKYEIKVENIMTGRKHDEWFHKEDIYEMTKENRKRLRK
jgi:hypothetical protein